MLVPVNAAIQRVPVRNLIAAESRQVAPGNQLPMNDLTDWLSTNGFERVDTVRDRGEFAVRGGIIDLFSPGAEAPVRLDFFGDTLESIRAFDTDSQRTTGQLRELTLVPMSEVVLTDASVSRFRQAYVAAFGAADRDDVLYQSISQGRRHAGLEHWLPMFHKQLDTVFDYVGEMPIILDHLVEEAVSERLDQIADHYRARRKALDEEMVPGAVPYRPIAPDTFYLTDDQWAAALADRRRVAMTPFAVPDGSATVVDLAGRHGRSFAAERASGDVNVFDAVIGHMKELQKSGQRVIIACWSEGSRERLKQVLVDHGAPPCSLAENWADALAAPQSSPILLVLGIESGFEIGDIAVIGEQDILGDRLVRSRKRSRRAADFLTEVTGLSSGDLVVHVDHGIGRFVGLRTIEAAGAPHDCLGTALCGR